MSSNHKFKVGDIVKYEWGGFLYIELGKTYKVKEVNTTGHRILIETLLEDVWYGIQHFSLYKQEFDMVNQPWFIRMSNGKEFELAKEFVKSKGFKFSFGEDYDQDSNIITNRDTSDKTLCKGLMYVIRSHTSSIENKKEIKLNFKTTIDSVEYPEVKSKEQFEIEEIETEMRKLADRLNKLKGN